MRRVSRLTRALLLSVALVLCASLARADAPSESYATWQVVTGTLALVNDSLILTNALMASASFQFNAGFTGTIVFEGTTDGLTWNAVHAYNAATVNSPVTSTTTFPSQWIMGVGPYRLVRARVSVATAGSMSASGLSSANGAPASISLGVSGVPTPDVSMQGTTLLNVVQTSAAATINTITITGAAGQRVTVRSLSCYLTGAAPLATAIVVKDGATTILDLASPTLATTLTNFTPFFPSSTGLTMSTGNNAVITVAAEGAATTSTCSVGADRS